MFETLLPIVHRESSKEMCYTLTPESLYDVLEMMKYDGGFNMLIDLTVVEYPDEMCGVYHLMRYEDKDMVRLEVPFSKDKMQLDSAYDIFAAADQMEREAYDLFGVKYVMHPNLERILCADDFVGHALRKDYVSNTRD